MHPAVRTQVDPKSQYYNALTAIDFEGTKLITRQEQKDDADAKKMFARFGVNVPMRNPQFGEANFDMGLQEAYQAVENAKTFWDKLPPQLKEQYPTWDLALAAVSNGTLRKDVLDKIANDAKLEASRKQREEMEREYNEMKRKQAGLQPTPEE